MEDRRVADYFVVAGVSQNTQFNTESKQLVTPIQPITDITVIFKSLGENCPTGYSSIEVTPNGHIADLNNGNYRSPGIFICYRRGNDKAPLVDIGVYYDGKERVLPDSEIVLSTPFGRCASTTNSSKSGTYLTYRRAKSQWPFNQLVVVDICVILNNKSEYPPNAFFVIRKNLNRSMYGMIGSEVFVCYKKSLHTPPSLCYRPRILSRFPLQDYTRFALPESVPLFCLPTGATIELWPIETAQPKPVFSTFVLTSGLAQKVYGSAISFYERYDESHLTEDQKSRLGLTSDNAPKFRTYAVKSICILSRWPFFDCFREFLIFLHKIVFHPPNSSAKSSNHQQKEEELISITNNAAPSNVTLEHYISHFLLDVPFPTSQRPKVLVQLMPASDDNVCISQPFDNLPLPLTGASFVQLLRNLGTENCMNLLLFGLSEQKILLHSLRPDVLTGVAEAITAMLFPFHWQCPYVPLCPLSLCGVLHAPLPFIVGIDSRCFDSFNPPHDVVCVDLDTTSIYLSELKKCLNLKLLPKRAARVLRASLDRIYQKLNRLPYGCGPIFNGSPSSNRSPVQDSGRVNAENKLELEIREAFIRFMATILKDFRSYLLPITKAPTIGATDPSSLFNLDGFLRSRDRNYTQFYQLITKTQMFTHYIEERSFVSDKDTSLAFFDDCEEKLAANDDIFSDRPIRLFETDELLSNADRYIFIPAPEQSPSVNIQAGQNNHRSTQFGPLNVALYHRHPTSDTFQQLNHAMNNGSYFSNHENSQCNAADMTSSHANLNDIIGAGNSSMSRRTKQEIKTSRKLAKKHSESPILWSKYLLSCCYSLWFSHLPGYISNVVKTANDNVLSTKLVSNILRHAYSILLRMQTLHLQVIDEICYRILMLLCGQYGQPALAVRVLFQMRKNGAIPNAVTYGYYNKAVLESVWPEASSKPTTIMWTKMRNVIQAISHFRYQGRRRMNRRCRYAMPLVGEAKFNRPLIDLKSVQPVPDQSYRSTTLPVDSSSVYAELESKSVAISNRGRQLSMHHSFSVHNQDSDRSQLMNSSETLSQKRAIHKSFSMHLRTSSQSSIGETSKTVDNDTNGDENDDSSNNNNNSRANETLIAANRESHYERQSVNLREVHYVIMDDSDKKISLIELVDEVDSVAGILFTSDTKSCANILKRRNTHCQNATTILDEGPTGENSNNFISRPFRLPSGGISSVGTSTIMDSKQYLRSKSFGNDTQIVRKIDTCSNYNNPSEAVSTAGEEVSSDDYCHILDFEDTSNNDDSELTSLRTPAKVRNQQLDSITSTPNFKFASLINADVQWASKWTPSQHSKSVYKGLKSAASGFVSSLQEFKTSFSTQNSNSPAKFLSYAAQTKSTATREMLSHWANYFTELLPPRAGLDEDETSSVSSNDRRRTSLEDDDTDGDFLPANTDKIYAQQPLLDIFNQCYSEDINLDFPSYSTRGNRDDVAIEIEMRTCIRCDTCKSLLFDEEIMERWSSNDSNLSIQCAYCYAPIVPLMSILVKDYRFNSTKEGKLIDIETEKSTDQCFSSESNNDERYSGDVRRPTIFDTNTGQLDQEDSNDDHKNAFTVPYLSPLVLRKEVENVLEGSGDCCLASSDFVDNHPIIFWNLVWFFTRSKLPSHLPSLCLYANTLLKEQEVSIV